MQNRHAVPVYLLAATLLAGCQNLLNKPDAGEPEQDGLRTAELTTTALSDPAPAVQLMPAALPYRFGSEPVTPDDARDLSSAPKATERPLHESAGDDHNEIETDLWQLTRDHFGLDLTASDPRVEAQLNWYRKHPKYLNRVASRASRYYYYVIHEVISRGIPAEIALLPIVESAYDPFAYSHGRAAGPWQFIPGTAKHFGLKKSWWYDGRRDIRASTDAALTYLSQLKKRFNGDWQLALAGYNAGGGNVSKAIRKNRKKNKPTDFWSLSLPRETSAYVPKLIALARIVKEPQRYGITLQPLPDEPYFDVVETGSQIDLAQAAELASVSVDEIYLLNPGFSQWATDPEGPHQLLVPYQQAESFRTALSKLPKEQRVTWKRYKIRSGDSLLLIARKHKTTVETLKTANNLRGNLIRAGQVLLIPTASKNAGAYALSSDQRQAKKSQRIALRSGKQKLKYKVRSGDSFWTIARRYKVGVRELASWNQMAPGDPLRIGKQLVIWQKSPVSGTADGNNGRNIIRKIGYRVRSGDSLSRIASRFNVRVMDIRRWNTLAGSKYLQPGQHLTLYVDVTRAR